MFVTIHKEEWIPDDWKVESVKLIHKGKTRTAWTYQVIRPNFFSRIEGFVVENILGEFQGGFRKGRNTMDKAFIITTPLGRARKRKNSSLFMAFIDLRKAFDKYLERKTMRSPKRDEAGRKNT